MIPKIIHYCWFGGGPKPKSVEKYIRSWKKYCSDYEIIEWNEDNFDISSSPLYVKQAYAAKKWAFVSDYARLKVVFECGGIYFDTDVQVIKNIDTLLQYDAFFGFENCGVIPRINLGLGFGAVKNHQLVKKLMSVYETVEFPNPNITKEIIAAPKLLTDTFRDYGYIMNDTTQKQGNDIVFSSEYLCPKKFRNGITTITNNTLSIHHYDSSWYDKDTRVKQKQKWKKYKLDRIRHFPNRLLIRLLGKNDYDSLKYKLRGKE